MRKKIISIILITLMLIAFIPSTAFAATSGTCPGGASWKVKNGTLTISGKGSTSNFNDYYPPWYGIEGIKKIVVSEGVIGIGDYAFAEMEEVKTVSLPKSLKYLGKYVFIGSYSLEKISIPDGNPDYCTDSQGVLYTISPDIHELYHVPAQHKGIFRINKEVGGFWKYAMNDCWYITGFEVEEGNNWFATDSQGALYNKQMTILQLVGQAYEGKFVVPESVTGFSTGISDSPFWYCSYLTEVVLSSKTTELFEAMFAGCWELKSVYIPRSLKNIRSYVFYECGKLTDIYYAGTQHDWEILLRANTMGNEVLQSVNVHYICEHKNVTKTYEGSCVENEMWKCNDCDGTFIGKEAPGHTIVTIPGREPTCSDYGLTEGHSCSVCGSVIDFQQSIGLAPHQGEWTITKEATADETGIKSRTCIICGEVDSVPYSIYPKGDVNGDGKINALDATQILRFANNKSSVLTNMEEYEILARGDVNNNGKINALDATQILRYANNKSSVLTK